MNSAIPHVELSLAHNDTNSIAEYDMGYTPEADFDPEFDIAQCVVQRRKPVTHIARSGISSTTGDLLSPPHTRDEALAAIRCTLGNLAVEMRSASAMPERESPITLPCGIDSLQAATGGFPRGALTEIYGPASSGRTSLLIAALAAATVRGETCALIDTADHFSPHTAACAGVVLERLLWVRCNGAQPARESNAPRFAANDFGGHDLVTQHAFPSHTGRLSRAANFHRLEQALKITDLLIHAGGFGLIAFDTAGLPPEVARRVPLASWFRFRRAVEHTPTALLALEQEPFAQNCASLVLRLERLHAHHTHVTADLSVGVDTNPGATVLSRSERAGVSNGSLAPSFAALLQALDIAVEIERAPQSVSRSLFGTKKPPRSATTQFRSTAQEQFRVRSS